MRDHGASYSPATAAERSCFTCFVYVQTLRNFSKVCSFYEQGMSYYVKYIRTARSCVQLSSSAWGCVVGMIATALLKVMQACLSVGLLLPDFLQSLSSVNVK